MSKVENSKKKRVWKIYPVLFVVSGLYAFIAVYALAYSIGGSVISLIFALLFGLPGYHNFKKLKQVSKENTIQQADAARHNISHSTVKSVTISSELDQECTTIEKSNAYQSTPRSSSDAVENYSQRRAALIDKKKEEFSQALEKIPRVPLSLSCEYTNRAKLITMPEIKYTNITRATNMDKLFPLVVVDTETTGLKPGGNDIIEISAIKYGSGFTPISCFTTLCKPRKPIPVEASNVNHITNDMVSDSPPFSLLASSFSEYISGCNLVGHNLGFDLRFLYISGVVLPPKAKYYDTLDLAKKVLTKFGEKKYNHRTGEYEEIDDWDVYDYKLDTLCEYYNVFRSESHRSLSDCYATALLFESLIDDKIS